jgi:solute carrier family 31 (copper transporter), member 1
MLFTWDTTNLCVVFRQWRITSNLSLVVSLAAIVAICAGYEALREGIRRYEATLSKRVDTAPRKCSLCRPLSSPLYTAGFTTQSLCTHGEPLR